MHQIDGFDISITRGDTLLLRFNFTGKIFPWGTEGQFSVKRRTKETETVLLKTAMLDDEAGAVIFLTSDDTDLPTGLYFWDLRLNLPATDETPEELLTPMEYAAFEVLEAIGPRKWRTEAEDIIENTKNVLLDVIVDAIPVPPGGKPTAETAVSDGKLYLSIGVVEGEKGEKGDQGDGFTILGSAYATLAELVADIAEPQEGDLYNVGTAPPYTVYRWTGTAWEDQGKVQGDAGADGVDGVDGVSPSARVVKADGVATITITDSGGKTTAEIMDCADEMAELKGLLAINTEFLARLTAVGSGSHNAVYRGKNLGTYVTDAQYAAIAAGTFDDLYIGDYWVIGGATYRIVAFDYYYGTGDIACTAHHITLVPDVNMYSYEMNDTNTTTGGYVGSKMYTTGLTQAKETINTAFGTAHILTHRQFLTNAVTNGRPSAGSWYDSTVELMTEQNVHGGKFFAPTSDGSSVPTLHTIDKSQYPLFAFRPDMISNRNWYSLRDVVSAAGFATVSNAGYAYYVGASSDAGVRPEFSIIGKEAYYVQNHIA